MNIIRAVKGTTHSEIENKVRAATCNENVAATTTQLIEIANATFHYKLYDDLYPQLCTRLADFQCPQHCYKSLIVVKFLLLNADVRFINDVRLNDTIHELVNYHFFSKGIEIGDKIREKAQECIDLLSNNDLLREQRGIARQTISNIVGYSSNDAYVTPTQHSSAPPQMNRSAQKKVEASYPVEDTDGYITSYSNVNRDKVVTPKKQITHGNAQFAEIAEADTEVDCYVVTKSESKTSFDPFAALPGSKTKNFDPFLDNEEDFQQSMDYMPSKPAQSHASPQLSHQSQISQAQSQSHPSQQPTQSSPQIIPPQQPTMRQQAQQKPQQQQVYTRQTNRGRSGSSVSTQDMGPLSLQRPGTGSTVNSRVGSPNLTPISPPSDQPSQIHLQQQQQQQFNQQQALFHSGNGTHQHQQSLFSPQNYPQQPQQQQQQPAMMRPTSSSYDHFGSLQQQAHQQQQQHYHQQQQQQQQQQFQQPVMFIPVAIQPQPLDPFAPQYDAFAHLPQNQQTQQQNIQSINSYHRPTSAASNRGSVSSVNHFNNATTYNPKPQQQAQQNQQEDQFDAIQLPF